MERSGIRISEQFRLVTTCFSYEPNKCKTLILHGKQLQQPILSREEGLGVVSVLPGWSPWRAEHLEVPALASKQGDRGSGERLLEGKKAEVVDSWCLRNHHICFGVPLPL